jgi:capsular polysaccharide transport system permease protein
MMRYGRDNIGFAWVILEPMILTAGVITIWSATAASTKYGIKAVEFIMTGYTMLTLWRHMTNSMVLLFRRSAPLLYHRSISLFDIVFSKACLEFTGASVALLLVWGTLNAFGVVANVARLDIMILGWLMMAWLAAATGMLVAAMTEFSEATERFVQPFQYLAIPLSGAFAMVDWLPKWGQDAILLNPMVHGFEIFRAGYFGPSVVTHFSYGYMSAWAFVLTFFGFVAVHRVRGRVQLS